MSFKIYLIAVWAYICVQIVKSAPVSQSKVFYFGLIADRDRNSRVEGQSQTYESILKFGELKYENDLYELVVKQDNTVVKTKYSHKGAGAELSEFIDFNGKYYAVDERTGILFEVDPSDKLIPWAILAAGDGNSRIGFDAKWATVRNDMLYVGSLATEYIDRNGKRQDTSFWVKTITKRGSVRSINWKDRYERVRKAMGIDYPGFVLHEAVNWSPINSQWVLMPKKCSTRPYDTTIESVGCNKIVIADEKFSDIQSIDIDRESSDPAAGFSSFKFIPGSKDKHILALRTVKKNDKTTTYAVVVNTDGKVLMPEKKISSEKFEGVLFFKEPTAKRFKNIS
uniref:Salivary apyrase n=1 Tax=Sergentomyia schwetzi TaxID=114605 RepID=A0A6B9VM83_9DIPT|nr:salivary apyrase [Sergentomyia schwetzi]